MEAAMMAHQAPFYFYAPDAKQAHFAQHLAMYPVMQAMPSTPIYSRPNSASSQRPVTAPTLFSNGPAMMTPVASPRPLAHKPTIMLDTEKIEPASPYMPSTPPLSTSGSIGSPGSCDVLQTPMNPMFSGLDGFKETFEVPETLPADWSNCGSPPMTPVYIQGAQPKVPSLSGSLSDISTASCPSLSPSPSPYARSVSSEQDVDFCDPRNLTVAANAANSTLAPLAALGEDESRTASSAPVQQSFAFNPVHGVPSFEDLSDLESEDDFVNGLVNLGPDQPSDVRRPRADTGSSVVSLGHGSFIGEEDFSFDDSESFSFSMPSPTSSCSDSDCHQDKRIKTSKTRKAVPIMQVAAGASQTTSESSAPQAAPTEGKSSSGSETPTTPLPAPPNRRGRKQSLTEDPSKQFVCDLCNRRFRRQEHLKRHYRSLHTQEKPFECHECGKKFSRSDNLSQHARTHGSGAIVMDLIDDPNAHHYDALQMYGSVLYHAAADVSGSASDMSSEDSDNGRKKRKRTD